MDDKSLLKQLGDRNPHSNWNTKAMWPAVQELKCKINNLVHDLGYKNPDIEWPSECKSVWDCIDEVNVDHEYRTKGNAKAKTDIETISELFVKHDKKISNEIMPVLKHLIKLNTRYFLGARPPSNDEEPMTSSKLSSRMTSD